MSEHPPRSKAEKPVESISVPAPLETEKPSEQPIVMLNPVLNKIAGLKERPKQKRRKSISEGGTAYVPMELQSTFGEEPPTSVWMEPNESKVSEKQMGGMEGGMTPSPEPETKFEATKDFKKAVLSLALERQVLRKQEILEELKEIKDDAEGGFERLGLFTSSRPIKERIADAESRISAFQQQKKNLEANLAALDAVEEPAPYAKFYRDIKPQMDLKTEARAAAAGKPVQDIFRRIYPAANSNRKQRSKFAKMRAAFAAIFVLGTGGAGIASLDSHVSHAAQPRAEATRVVSHEKFAPIIATVKHGEGADAAFGDLRKQLHERFRHAKDVPELVKHILLVPRLEDFSRAYGFVSHDGKSERVIHPGDQLLVNDQGQLVFQEKGGKPHVIIENVQPGKPSVIHPVTGKSAPVHRTTQHAHSDHHASATHHAAAQHNEHIPVHAASHESPYKVNTTFHGAQYTPAPEAQPAAAHEQQPAASPTPEAAPHAAPAEAHEAPAPTVSPTAHETPAPVAEPAPAAEVPKAQAVEQRPEASPASIPTPEAVITNSHNVEVHATKAEIYEDKSGHLVAYGGNDDERFTLAQAYVNTHKNTYVLFKSSYIDSATGNRQEAMGALSSDTNGTVTEVPDPTNDSGDALPIPTVEDLVKKIS